MWHATPHSLSAATLCSGPRHATMHARGTGEQGRGANRAAARVGGCGPHGLQLAAGSCPGRAAVRGARRARCAWRDRRRGAGHAAARRGCADGSHRPRARRLELAGRPAGCRDGRSGGTSRGCESRALEPGCGGRGRRAARAARRGRLRK
eukprot:365811-Chlamydomonas_euryale.AAC.1